MDITDHSGAVVGAVVRFGNDHGPRLYGDVPFRLEPDAEFRDRVLAVIGSLESPLASETDRRRPASPPIPSLNSVQAFESHGISCGLCQAISRYGAAPALVREILTGYPELQAWYSAAGYAVSDERDRFLAIPIGTDQEDDAQERDLTLGSLRSNQFALATWHVLGGHTPPGLQEEAAAAQERRDAIQETQAAFFWQMVQQRWRLAQEAGWVEALLADERAYAMFADISIQHGVATQRKILQDAEQKTAAGLAEARIGRAPTYAARTRFVLGVQQLSLPGGSYAPILQDGMAVEE